MKTILNREGVPVVMNRNGEVATKMTGRERENITLYGAKLKIEEGQNKERSCPCRVGSLYDSHSL